VSGWWTLAVTNARRQTELGQRSPAEEALRKPSAELERRVAERTQALEEANARLRERERALADKTALLESTFDALDQGICVLDEHQKLLAWNKAFAGLAMHDAVNLRAGMAMAELMQAMPWVGYEPDAGARPERVLAPSDAPRSDHDSIMRACGVEQIAANERLLQVGRLHKPDGGFVFTVADVTEQQQIFSKAFSPAGAPVPEPEDKIGWLAAIVDSSFDAIISKKLDGQITSWNAAAEHIYGYSAAEMIGQSIEIIVPEDRRGELRSIHERLRRGERVPPFETVRLTRDGRRIDVQLTMSPIIDSEGAVVGASGIGRDITQRQQAEVALRDREAKFRAVIETAADGIIIIDPQGTIQVFNPASERIFGYRPDEVIGRKIEMLMPPSHAVRHDQYLERARRTDEGQKIVVGREVEGLRKDGATVPLELSVGAARQDGTQIFVGIVRDISERKRADRERQSALDELARSNQDLEQFADVVSHDLQEPLRMVSSYCELLRRGYRGRLDDDADQFIDFAVDGAQRMQLLIQDLLAYSRVGSRGGAFGKTDANHSFELALVNLQEAIAESQVRISADPLPTVFADEVQLVQLFQNLVGNAIKYRRGERPEIHVTAESRGAFWAFAVTDNGIGIKPQFARSIFEVFKRLHSRREFPGTGIGLAVCKRIVERHGGEIWLDCEYRDGARFCFTLPGSGGRS
jgi:PAS domain S-box-containing protein